MKRLTFRKAGSHGGILRGGPWTYANQDGNKWVGKGCKVEMVNSRVLFKIIKTRVFWRSVELPHTRLLPIKLLLRLDYSSNGQEGLSLHWKLFSVWTVKLGRRDLGIYNNFMKVWVECEKTQEKKGTCKWIEKNISIVRDVSTVISSNCLTTSGLTKR